MPSKGYDTFAPSPGAEKEMSCKVCGTVCDCSRNAYGPTGFAESVGGMGHAHDRFTCPNTDEDWHKQVIGLMREIENTASGSLRAMMTTDIRSILKIQEINKFVPDQRPWRSLM